MKNSVKGILSACVGLALTGCGEDGRFMGDLFGSAESAVVLRFQNAQSGPPLQLNVATKPQALNQRSVTAFEMKLISVYLAQDVEPSTQNNVGQTAMIYLNPTCQDDIMHCSVAPGNAEDGRPFTHVITDFFNFAADSNTVNAALNAQARGVPQGDYKYARIEFCKYGAGNEPNIRWAADGVPARGFAAGHCGVTSAPMNPPLHLEPGRSVAVTLSYDLSLSLREGSDAFGLDCADSDLGPVCFDLPQFIPSAQEVSAGGSTVIGVDAGSP